MKISLVIPAYNEEKNIRKTIIAYKSYLEGTGEDYEIIAVDDGSCDNTLAEIKSIDNIICITYSQNRGKGYAVKRAMLRATGDYIFFTDGDLSYEPSDIGRAIAVFKSKSVNMVAGERIDKKEKYSVLRRLASFVLGLLLRYVLKLDTEDSQCGFKGFDKKSAREIFSQLRCSDFGFDFEVLFLAKANNLKRTSLPVSFTHRDNSRVNIISDSVRILKGIMQIASESITFENRRDYALSAVLVLLAVFRFSYLGYDYTPYLDDNVQYTLYPSMSQPWQTVLTGGAGVLFTRPLAGLADFFIWSRFDGALGIGVFIISVLYAWSAVLFQKTLKDIKLGVTAVFTVFYIFCPVNIEGTYWLSASSRIVVSLFLTALSCRLLIREKMLWFWLCNAAAMCFYEQTAVLAFVLPVIICRFIGKRGIKIPVINLSAVAAYYLCFGKMSNNSGRIGVGLTEIPQRIKQMLEESVRMWGQAQFGLITKGFERGLNRIITDRAVLWILILAALAAVFFVLIRYEEYFGHNTAKKVCVGLMLGAASMLPPGVSTGNLNFRNAVPALLGAALVADGLVPLFFRRATPFVLTACIMCFGVVSVSEVCDYDLTARRDLELAQRIAESIPAEFEQDLEAVSCSCTAPVRFEQNVEFNDHIISIRGSAWGITGAVKAAAVRTQKTVKTKKFFLKE